MKKVCGAGMHGRLFNSLVPAVAYFTLSAGATTAMVSAAAAASTAAMESAIRIESAFAASASAFDFVLPPQEANDTATIATNKNANFLIFFAF